MTDSEKIDFIRAMLQDFWGTSENPEQHAICMLNALATVVDFNGKGESNG